MNIEEIVASFASTRRRVFPIEIDGERFWVKRAAKNFPNPMARLLGGLGRRVASAGLDHEIAALAALRKRGFKTPDVIFHNRYYMVLSDTGPTLQQLVKEGISDVDSVVTDAGRLLRRLHDAGGWHGAARLHNMTRSGDEMGFIDVENTSSFWLPIPILRAWDLWQLCGSIAYFDADGSRTANCLRGYGNGKVFHGLWAASALMIGPYLALKPFQRWLKRELRQAVVTMQAIFHLGWSMSGG